MGSLVVPMLKRTADGSSEQVILKLPHQRPRWSYKGFTEGLTKEP